MKLVFVFDHFGPYHEARVGAVAAAGLGEVTGVELHPRSRTYGWEPGEGRTGAFRKISLPRVEWSGRAERRALRPHLERVLGECGPDVVFVNGWGDFMSLETIAWAKRAGVRVVVMSETRRVDGERSWWGEWVKSRIVGLFDAGLCGGESHRRYLGELGLARQRVVLGYNAVDNDFFGKSRELGAWSEAPEARISAQLSSESTTRAKEIGDRGAAEPPMADGGELMADGAAAALDGEPLRGGSGTGRSPSLQIGTKAPEALALDAGRWTLDSGLPARQPYFLASNRFIERKNLGRLIRAYARYCAGRAAQDIEDGRSKVGVESGKSPATSDSPLATPPIGEQLRGVWPLVLLGDGELRGELEALCGELGLRIADGGGLRADGAHHGAGSVEQGEAAVRPIADGEGRMAEGSKLVPSSATGDELDSGRVRQLNAEHIPTGSSLDSAAQGAVIFAGFRQVEELRDFYAGAGAFIHPALAEPWGLVINEAMASGLPILSSRNVGAAEELVREGVNGFSFDPEDVKELAGLMGRVAGMSPEERSAMGEASLRLIAEWGPERFAQGAEEAARLAMAGPAKRAGVFDRMLLEVLIRR